MRWQRDIAFTSKSWRVFERQSVGYLLIRGWMKQNGENEIEPEAYPDLIQRTTRLFQSFYFPDFWLTEDLFSICSRGLFMFTPAPQEFRLAPRRPCVLRGGHKAIVYFIFVLVDSIENCLMFVSVAVLRVHESFHRLFLVLLAMLLPGRVRCLWASRLGKFILTSRRAFSRVLLDFRSLILSLARAVSQAISALCQR